LIPIFRFSLYFQISSRFHRKRFVLDKYTACHSTADEFVLDYRLTIYLLQVEQLSLFDVVVTSTFKNENLKEFSLVLRN